MKPTSKGVISSKDKDFAFKSDPWIWFKSLLLSKKCKSPALNSTDLEKDVRHFHCFPGFLTFTMAKTRNFLLWISNVRLFQAHLLHFCQRSSLYQSHYNRWTSRQNWFVFSQISAIRWLVNLKYIYSEKAAKFYEIFTLLLTGTW